MRPGVILMSFDKNAPDLLNLLNLLLKSDLMLGKPHILLLPPLVYENQ